MLTLRVQVGPHISHLYDHNIFLTGIPVSSLATDQNILSIAARKTHLNWRSIMSLLCLKTSEDSVLGFEFLTPFSNLKKLELLGQILGQRKENISAKKIRTCPRNKTMGLSQRDISVD